MKKNRKKEDEGEREGGGSESERERDKTKTLTVGACHGQVGHILNLQGLPATGGQQPAHPDLDLQRQRLPDPAAARKLPLFVVRPFKLSPAYHDVPDCFHTDLLHQEGVDAGHVPHTPDGMVAPMRRFYC